jgi:hypothetical protein
MNRMLKCGYLSGEEPNVGTFMWCGHEVKHHTREGWNGWNESVRRVWIFDVGGSVCRFEILA